MLRHNKHFQEFADKCAKDNGYFCASYLGRMGDSFIYAPRYSDNKIRCEGYPPVIVINDDEPLFFMGMESFDFLKDLKFRDYKKGRSMFREYERKYYQNDFASDEECEYISDIVNNQQPSYDIPVEKKELYDYLEIADRLNMKIELKPQENSMERHDGWEYYIELVKK